MLRTLKKVVLILMAGLALLSGLAWLCAPELTQDLLDPKTRVWFIDEEQRRGWYVESGYYDEFRQAYVLHGHVRDYSVCGVLEREFFYNQGMLHGTQSRWRDGRLAWTMEWYHGRLHGVAIDYSYGRELMPWEDGFRHGEYKLLNPDGSRAWTATLARGRLHGRMTGYWNDAPALELDFVEGHCVERRLLLDHEPRLRFPRSLIFD